MRCPEFREIMGLFLDGEVDGKTRKDIARHLVQCQECAELVESNRFWNEKVCGYLEHELPAGLREEILGDLAPIGWREKLRVAWWAIRRDLAQPRKMLQTAALAVVLILAVNYLPFFRSADKSKLNEAFGQAGPIVQVGQDLTWQPGETVPTARLSLSGRLI